MAFFSLTDENWIPALDAGGAHRLVSLETLFAEASSLRDLALPPAERIAVLRLLVCIAQAALREELTDDVDDPETEVAAALTPSVATYLAKWRASFALFGDGPRFLQFRTAKTESTPASKLFFPLASGNNATLFDHDGGSGRTFPPERLAMGLLTYQNFSPLIGRGYFGRAPGVTSNTLHVFRWGATLEQWLLRNLILPEDASRLCPEHELGRPVWELPPASVGTAVDKDDPAVLNATMTVLGRLVPLTRALWLNDDFASVILDNGLAFPEYPICREPSAAGRLVKKSKTGQEDYHLLGARLERAIWRDLDAVLCLDTIKQQSQGMPATLRHIPHGQDCPVWTGAVITDFKAKVEDAVEAVFIRDLALPHQLLDPTTSERAADAYQDAMKAATTWEEHLVKAVYAFGSELKLDHNRRGTLRESAVSAFWTLLGAQVPHLFDLVRLPESAGGTGIANPNAKTPWHRALAVCSAQAFRSVCLVDGPRQLLAWGNALRLLHPPNPDKPTAKKARPAKKAPSA